MMKIEIPLIGNILLEIWKRIERAETYQEELKIGLLKQIYKDGDLSVTMNYMPASMISGMRKVIETAIVEGSRKILKVHGRKHELKRVLSSKITLLVVDALGKLDETRSQLFICPKHMIKPLAYALDR